VSLGAVELLLNLFIFHKRKYNGSLFPMNRNPFPCTVKRDNSEYSSMWMTKDWRLDKEEKRRNSPQVLSNLKNETDWVVLDLKSVKNGGKTLVELNINDGTNDGSDVSILNGSGSLMAN
jgi:hypothetical protein